MVIGKLKKNLKKKETYLNKNFYRDNNWYYYVLIGRIKNKIFNIFN